ncbi:MAG TPA: diguanylate cyclase [bacterium]|nr:diguanylate cyclase [bacterium]
MALALLIAADLFNLHEVLTDWIGAKTMERYQIDELFIVFALLGFGLIVFGYRRWGETRRVIERYDEVEKDLRDSEGRLRQILNELPVAVLVRSADGSVPYRNDLAVRLFGASPAASPQHSIMGAHLYRAGSPEPYPVDALPDVRALKGERVTLDDIEARHGTDKRNLNSLALPILDSLGHITHAVVVAGDVTDQRRADVVLHNTADRLATTVATLSRQTADMSALSEMVHLLQLCPTLPDAYAVIPRSIQQILPGASGVVYFLDPSRTALEAAVGWGSQAPAVQTFKPDDCWAVRRGQAHVVGGPEGALVCPHVERIPDGGYACVPLKARGESIGVLFVSGSRRPLDGAAAGETASPDELGISVSLIGEHLGLALANLRLWETLRTQSIRDPLTGLYNRRFMEDAFERELSRAGRGHHPVGCAMFDLDHFKRFNDTYGHQAGDTLLRELGRLLRSLTRHNDIVCRYGGEEFVWILPEASRDEILRRAEQFKTAVEKLTVTHLGRGLGTVTVSLGISMFPEHGETVEALLRLADLALYTAKAGGRNRIEMAMA